jgi:hypothetical protein
MKGFASRIHVFEYTNGSSYINSQCSVHPRSDMSSIRHWCIIFAAIGLLCLSSCVTPDSHRPALPDEARFDPEAGRGGLLRLKVHLADGEELGCVVDTGSPLTLFKTALAPRFGTRLGTTIGSTVRGPETNGVYRAPALYLGSTLLQTGPRVFTHDAGADQVMLGMDTLSHYCVQLDFAANKIRFLEPDGLDVKSLGEPFRLTFSKDGYAVAHGHLLGVRWWLIDTGTPLDGLMTPRDFDRALRDERVAPCAEKLNDVELRCAFFPRTALGGNTYPDLMIGTITERVWIPNILGLNFLARNLVTLNFPKRVMYLKPASGGEPLDLSKYLTLEAGMFLESLEERGQLPGWSKSKDEIDWTVEGDDARIYPISRGFKCRGGGWVDVTPRIKSLAAAGGGSIPVTNDLAGRDPAPQILKRLRVEFRRNGRYEAVEAKEGETLVLPSGAEVVSARYGNLQADAAQSNRQDGDTATYHYTVVRESEGSRWKLQRAWRTDGDERVAEEYPVP